MGYEHIEFQLDVAIDVEKVLNIAKETGGILIEGSERGKSLQEGDAAAQDCFTKDDIFSKGGLLDRCARGFVSMELMQMSPHIPIVSEDMNFVPYPVVKSYQSFWSVSIVDGETAYRDEHPQFTVNVALIRAGEPCLGVVHMPYDEVTYWAVKGKGAFVCVGAEGPSEVVKVRSYSECEKGLPIVKSSQHQSTETDAFCMQFLEPEITSSLNAFNFMRVADGSAAMFPHLDKSQEWDTAAAQIIVEEAGGIVVKYPDMTPLTYGKEDRQNPPFVAYGNRLVPEGGVINGYSNGDFEADEFEDMFQSGAMHQ